MQQLEIFIEKRLMNIVQKSPKFIEKKAKIKEACNEMITALSLVEAALTKIKYLSGISLQLTTGIQRKEE